LNLKPEIMRKIPLLIRKTALLIFIITGFPENSSAQFNSEQSIVILSLDGFRWDYNQKTQTPALDLIAKDGMKATSLIPSFPSKTFPNHYTIATGLYPDHHGLVNNLFFDESLGKSFSIGNKEARFNPDFYEEEPI